MSNNLFSYATSELSQDAFICWLLSFAMKDCKKDDNLSACAKDFIRFFIPELDAEIYLSEPPKKQYKSVDVLITVNDKYKVIIEDKTFSSEHDNQLLRYKEIVENDFPDYTVIGVYYKTGFQSDLKNVYEANYKICDRKNILELIERHINNTKNNILIDYYEHIKSLDDEVSLFYTLPVGEWGWSQINGFYDYCQKNLVDTGMSFTYGYVPNKDGGFEGMWIYNDTYKVVDDLNCELYLQCEFVNRKLNICYRASTSIGKINGETREKLVWKQINGEWFDIAKQNGFIKPKRYGSGKTVALGIYDYSINTYEDAIAAICSAIKDFHKLVKDLSI